MAFDSNSNINTDDEMRIRKTEEFIRERRLSRSERQKRLERSSGEAEEHGVLKIKAAEV